MLRSIPVKPETIDNSIYDVNDPHTQRFRRTKLSQLIMKRRHAQ